MAATERAWGPLVAAALALPGTLAAQGVTPQPASAPAPGPAELGASGTPTLLPGASEVAVRWLSYRDWQPGLRRIRVDAPALQARLALGSRWSLEGSATLDSVSGASPRYHSAISGASQMHDRRQAGDLRVTRHDDRASWSAAAAWSDENDFRSRALSVRRTLASEDNNRVWTLEAGWRGDRIGSVNDPALDRDRRTLQAAASWTQALSRRDLVQVGLSLADGRGHFSDPYKLPDLRPERRRQTVVTARWHHHLDTPDVALRAAWRHYRDSFGIVSETLTLESAWAATRTLTLTPLLRLYTQSAADFYYNPRYAYAGIPVPPGWSGAAGQWLSADQRLAAFGAVTVGLSASIDLGNGWQADAQVQRYEQRTGWRFLREGSRGLDPLSARWVQVGLSRRF